MNWTAEKRLRALIRNINPEHFDYREPNPTPFSECGCVLWHSTQDACVQLLRVTRYEEMYLAGYADFQDSDDPEWSAAFREIDPTAVHFTRMTAEQAKGEAGIREALRRLDVVAQRYGGEPASPSTFVADESKFLAELKATITQPLPVEERL